MNRSFDRDSEIRRIRNTYAGYRDSRRYGLWDRRNPGFARIVRERDAAMVQLLRSSLPSSGGAVLDLGSGDGRMAEVARQAGLGASWIGVDIDPASVAAAREAYPWASFIEASADELPFATASFDAVIASTLFSSLPSATFEGAVAAEIERVLRPSGWLVWYDLRYGNPVNEAVHGVTRSRLGALFPGWRSQLSTMTLLPPVARRLGRLTPILYPALHALPLVRSHLIGRLQRP
jgi:SAM-dependent methyltransferase